MKISSLVSFILCSILFCSTQLLAIEILQIKNNKVLLNLGDEDAAVNQKLYLINSAGKKIAIATILQIKNKRALALINKGKSDGATAVELLNKPVSSENSAPAAVTGNKIKGLHRLNNMKISALLTFSMNNMNTKQDDISLNKEDVLLKGSAIGLTGAIDYPFRNWVILRGTLGYEPFVASGTARFLSCDSKTSTNCNANIQYLSGGGYARFNLTNSQYLAWVGLGGTGKFPISKSTTALAVDDVKFTMTFALTTGLDYFINNKNFIPASLEYQLFQNSETVSTNIIMLRAGYGWSF